MTHISYALRRQVQRRARGLCEYCRSSAELTGHDFTIDHILPESQGGASGLGNLCWCCLWCNAYKQARTHYLDRRTRKIVPLFNPRSDNWNDHFRWNSHATKILGRTPIGRATIQGLHLNRPILVKARRMWAQFGLHPPRF